MNNTNCTSLSCGQHRPWHHCGSHHWGCGHFSGCVANDGTPACNPWAPWGQTAGDCISRCGHWDRWNQCGCRNCSSWPCNSCGCIAGDSTCNSCGCNPCTCNQCGCAAGDVTGGCLLPRIISTGRTFQRRITQTLCVDDIPDCAESPLTLVSVTVSGQASWEQISECRQTLLRVTVPVAVQIRDCAGRCRTGHATVTLTIPLCTRCPAQDFWRGQLFVAPCIRLAAPVTENEDGCFDATLEVQAEVFLVRMQVVNC